MEYLDDMFGQFAEAFVGNHTGEGDIAYRENLNVSALDYSAESLHEVDRYLQFVFETGLDATTIEYQNTVVWIGAYVGEVIRRNARVSFHWMEYEDYMQMADPGLRNLMPLMLTTHALLVATSSRSMIMPMNKIARYLDEGDTHNIHFYASVDIKRTH